MGKAWIKLRMPDEIFVGFLDQVATNLGRHNSREAHFSLPEPVPPGGSFTDVHIALRGHDFTYKNGALVGGIVTKVTYEDEDGNDFAVFTGLRTNLAKVALSPDGLGLQDAFLKGNDHVRGSAEAEILYGGPGNDVIRGFNGDDTIAGGRGDDLLTGDNGSDLFNFLAAGSPGNDTITDFEPGLVVAAGVVQDLLVVDELPDLTKMKQLGANTVIDLGDGFSITLVNVLVTDITADDFEVRM